METRVTKIKSGYRPSFNYKDIDIIRNYFYENGNYDLYLISDTWKKAYVCVLPTETSLRIVGVMTEPESAELFTIEEVQKIMMDKINIKVEI